MSELTQKRLKELLSYDKKTGLFFWKKDIIHNVKAGEKAGTLSSGYVLIGVDGRRYKAHRLAWLFVKGFMPKDIEIDHIDRVRSNNKFKNLRLASRQCNSRNCKVRTTSTSGITGVSLFKKTNKWRSHIVINNKQIHLGYYKSKTSAAIARWDAEKKYNFPDCNTTSSAYLFIKKICCDV